MTDGEKKDLIICASKLIENGVHTTSFDNEEVKKMMKKIAANAVIIGLFNFNGFVISHIYDGDFTTIKNEHWKETKNDLIRRLAIIDNNGEDLKDLLGVEEIKEAVKYTIFEETGEVEDNEQTDKKS